MKYKAIENYLRNPDESINWKKMALTPFLLGIAFGAGCYVAKVIINSPLMSNITNTTA